MKLILTILLLTISNQIFSQKCNCSTKPELKEIISCKKTIFKNGAQLFWNFNCDSSWLIFRNHNKNKTLFSLDKDLIELTGRLGYSNWIEFENSFLIENKVISGCCDPSEYFLFNKENGNIIKDLGTQLYLEIDRKKRNPFIITLSDFNTILFTNLITNKSYTFSLPKGRLEKSLAYSDYQLAEYLFENGKLVNNIFSIKYKYKVNKKAKWENSIIKFDTKKIYQNKKRTN